MPRLSMMLALGAWLALGCDGPPPDTPSAVIELRPEAICQGDGFATPIVVSGAMSSRHLALIPLPPEDTAYPDGATVAPLGFAWSFEGDAIRITSGTMTSDVLTITAAGMRPLQVTLTTTNLVGGTATSLRTLPITVPTPWPPSCTSDSNCPGGACSGGACVGTTQCSATTPCANPCFTCDSASSLCVPRHP